MDNATSMYIIAGVTLFLLSIDLFAGHLSKKGTWSLNEMGVNIFSYLNFVGTRFVLATLVAFVFTNLLGSHQGLLAGVSFWVVFPIYLLVDEYIHYWIHRLAHTIPWMWRLHKPHHAPEHLNIMVTFRANWLWFFILPGAWLTGLMIWAGQPEVGYLGIALIGIFNVIGHGRTRWDLPLHRFWLTKPIMRVVEKIVTLPDTHHAHHGTGRYGHGMCNYGAFIFIFDVLHGTAEFPRCEQDAYGLPKLVKIEPWYQQLWWPIAKDAVPADLHPPTAAESQGTRTFTGNGGRFSISM